MKTVWSVLAALIALAVASAAPGAASPSRIVFSADRAPTTSGEIYVVAPDGTVTDLSRSPAADVFPTASSDGGRVAFARLRIDTMQIEVVNSDGSGLHAVSPLLRTQGPGYGGPITISWSSDGRSLAVVRANTKGATLYVTRSSGGGWRAIASGLSGQAAQWSPDGRRLAFSTNSGLVRVVAPDGRRVWTTSGTGSPAWSAHGLLAVQGNSSNIAVYDAAGHRRTTFSGTSFAWQPGRDVLASIAGGRLELRSKFPGASTRFALPARNAGQVQWVDVAHVRYFADGWAGFDITAGRPWQLPPGADAFNSAISAAGTGVYEHQDLPTSRLVLAGHIVRIGGACVGEETFRNLQFLGATDSVLYQAGCAPSGDIYSIAPDGTGLQQLTATPTHEFDPALSPDGSRIVYSQQAVENGCKGCAESLWVSGTRLTFTKETDPTPFDDHPSWSPDGSTVVFTRSGANSPMTLFTIAAAGGIPTSLGVRGSDPAWGPKLIAFTPWNAKPPAIATLDPATGVVKTVVSGKNLNVLDKAWSSDGRLAYLAPDAKNHVWIRIVGGAAVDLTAHLARGSRVTALAWAPDGKRFAFVADDADGTGEIYTIGSDGRGLVQVTKDLGVIQYGGSISWR